MRLNLKMLSILAALVPAAARAGGTEDVVYLRPFSSSVSRL
jgi:hypothetical protein